MEREKDLVGQILLGKLEVIRKLGGGGMGEVYEVEHRLTGHRRALKVVHPQFADRPRFMKRLLREAKVAGTLETEHVVETYDAGRLEDGSAYVLMELLRGCTLYDSMQARGTIEPRRLAGIMAQVAEGISVAHRAGIVHRDLKPENIFLTMNDGEERVRILDFGVSKFERTLDEAPTRLTAEGTLVGTPYYMSPEQAAGQNVDARTDVYAMGIMIYEALTGRLPFEADSVGELFVKIGSGQCVPLESRLPELDPRWAAIAHRAFHRDPAERYPDAEALRRELLGLLDGGLTAARAKTISDGARATVGYMEPLPAPPKPPREMAAALEAEERRASGEPDVAAIDDEDDEPRDPDDSGMHALAAPPRPGGRAGFPPWAWAAVGAAIVIAILVPIALLRPPPSPAGPVAIGEPSDGPSDPASPEEPLPELSNEPPPVEAPPVEAPSVAATADATPDAGVRARRGRPERGTRNHNPATAAGLDPNPYR